jgi:hypothetical protein
MSEQTKSKTIMLKASLKTSETSYFVIQNGSRKGPWDHSQISILIQEQKLTAQDQISSDGTQWMKLIEHKEFQSAFFKQESLPQTLSDTDQERINVQTLQWLENYQEPVEKSGLIVLAHIGYQRTGQASTSLSALQPLAHPVEEIKHLPKQMPTPLHHQSWKKWIAFLAAGVVSASVYFFWVAPQNPEQLAQNTLEEMAPGKSLVKAQKYRSRNIASRPSHYQGNQHSFENSANNRGLQDYRSFHDDPSRDRHDPIEADPYAEEAPDVSQSQPAQQDPIDDGFRMEEGGEGQPNRAVANEEAQIEPVPEQ